VVEHQPSKHKALSSTPSTTKKKKPRNKIRIVKESKINQEKYKTIKENKKER
jgi:hypothetical protein